MTKREDLPDLVRDTELLADFHQDNVTIHKKRWNHAKREIWYRQRILGHGGYGLVWLEQELDRKGKPKDKSFRAVKQIRSTKPGSNLADFVRELEAVAKFSQEKYQDFFVKSHGWYESPEALHIAMEYCPFGDLQKYTASRGSLPEEEAKVVMRQVFRGLAHMHEEKFAHRDLKPANILVVSHPPDEWTVKLSDFGLSKRTVAIESTTVRGTPSFIPPEMLGFDARKSDVFAGDMWCAGETTFQLLTSTRVFDSIAGLLNYVQTGTSFPINTLANLGVSEECSRFIQGMMAVTPADRPAPSRALTDPWLFVQEPDDAPQLPPDIQVNWFPPSPLPDDEIEPSAAWTTMTSPQLFDSPIPAPILSPTPSAATKVGSDDGAASQASDVTRHSPIQAQVSTPDLLSSHMRALSTDDRERSHDDEPDYDESSIELTAKKVMPALSPSAKDSWASQALFRNPNEQSAAGKSIPGANQGVSLEDLYRASSFYVPGDGEQIDDDGAYAKFRQYFYAHAKVLWPWPTHGDLAAYRSGQPVLDHLRKFLEQRLLDPSTEDRSQEKKPRHCFWEDCPNNRNSEISLDTCGYCLNTFCDLHQRPSDHDCPIFKPFTSREHRSRPSNDGLALTSSLHLEADDLHKRERSPNRDTRRHGRVSPSQGASGRGVERGSLFDSVRFFQDIELREDNLQFQELRKAVQEDPSKLTDFLDMLVQSNPELASVIQGQSNKFSLMLSGDSPGAVAQNPSSSESHSDDPEQASQGCTIKLERFDDPTAKRNRPKFEPIVRVLSKEGGEIAMGRYRETYMEEIKAPVIGFRSKVVSRRHGKLIKTGDVWYIQDVGSASGTFLNNIRLSAPNKESKSWPLDEGDLVQLGVDYSAGTAEDIYGAVQFRVHFPDAAEMSRPVTASTTPSVVVPQKQGEQESSSTARKAYDKIIHSVLGARWKS